MTGQLHFDLPVRPALGRDAFFVSPSNALAVAMIDGWRDWPGRKLALIGPKGAGKTHLAHVWAAEAGARIIPATDLAQADIPALVTGPVAVEDVPQIAGTAEAEAALFHLHNLVLAEGHALLVTGTGSPKTWALTLPDLMSRMEGTQAAILNQPDDALLGAVLSKLFADRQLSVGQDVIAYLVRRIDRSFEAAQRIVARIDAEALARKHAITRPFVTRLLDSDDTPS